MKFDQNVPWLLVLQRCEAFCDISNPPAFASSYVTTIGKYFSATDENIKKPRTLVVHHLLIDMERFVCLYVMARKQVIQLGKHGQFCI